MVCHGLGQAPLVAASRTPVLAVVVVVVLLSPTTAYYLR